MRTGGAVRADRRRRALRRADGRVPWAVERVRSRQDRADGRRSGGSLRVPPRLPRQRSRPRLRLRALGTPDHGGRCPDRLRPRRHRAWRAGKALAPVLVLLRLQRLEQPARGRLGDGPARLRRERPARGARHGARVDRLQLARGRRARGLGRRQARARRRDASGRLSRGRVAREQVHGGALPRELGRAGRRLRRHAGAACRSAPDREDDLERARRGSGGVPLDRLRRALGRAAGGVLQRPDRAQSEAAVDGADRMVGGVERPELRGADRRSVRDECDGLLLHGGREGLAQPRPAPPRPGCSPYSSSGRCSRSSSSPPFGRPGPPSPRSVSRGDGPGARSCRRRVECTSGAPRSSSASACC